MSLYPGAPRWDDTAKQCVLDEKALEQSMALEMEKAMKDVFKKVKGIALPEEGEEDRWLLFVAISRGILKYLHDNQQFITAADQLAHSHEVNLDVDLVIDPNCK